MKLLLRPISILKGLHWVSWCVLLVVGLGLLLIMVPGEEFSVVRGQPLSDTWDANSLSLFTITQSNVDEPLKGARSFFRTPFEHGWPARYLVRSIERCDLRLGIAWNPPPPPSKPWIQFSDADPFQPKGVSWSSQDNWPFESKEWSFCPVALLVDIIVGAIILGCIGGFVEWRARCGSKGIRFRLFDVMVGLAVMGCLISPFAYHRHIQRVEAVGKQLVNAEAVDTYDDFSEGSYHGPIWLRKLVGSEHFLASMHHVDRASIDPGDDWRKEFAVLEKFPYLASLHVKHWLPVDAIESLQRCRRLTHLRIPPLNKTQLSRLKVDDLSLSVEILSGSEAIELELAESDAITIVADDEDMNLVKDELVFGVEDLAKLTSLNLESIELEGNMIGVEHIRLLADMPSMRTIVLVEMDPNDEEYKNLIAENPHIQFHFRTNNHNGKPKLYSPPRTNLRNVPWD